MPASFRLTAVAFAALATLLGPARAQDRPVPDQRPPAVTETAPADGTGSATGAAAWSALVGNTISGKSSSGPFSEFFDKNGTVKYVDQNGLSTGTWSQQGVKVCFDFPDDDDRSCSAFEVQGTTGTSVDDDGVPVHFDILPGNAKGM